MNFAITDGVSFNKFLDIAHDFCREYEDSATYTRVAKAIVRTLMEDIYLPLDHPHHPFTLYAEEEVHSPNVSRLKHAVMAQFAAGSAARSAVTSFFHSGGSQREALDELLEEYYNFVEAQLDDTDENADVNQEPPVSPNNQEVIFILD